MISYLFPGPPSFPQVTLPRLGKKPIVVMVTHLNVFIILVTTVYAAEIQKKRQIWTETRKFKLLGCKTHTKTPQQPFQRYNWSTVCGWFLQAWLLTGWARLLCNTGFYQHWVQGCVSKHPKSPRDLPLPASACWPSVNLRLVADLSISERASGRHRGLDSWICYDSCLLDFREDGGCVPPPQSH